MKILGGEWKVTTFIDALKKEDRFMALAKNPPFRMHEFRKSLKKP